MYYLHHKHHANAGFFGSKERKQEKSVIKKMTAIKVILKSEIMSKYTGCIL